jgi:hypothetical protein
MEYSITGFLKAAAVSLKISIDSFSKEFNTELVLGTVGLHPLSGISVIPNPKQLKHYRVK